MRTAFLVHVSAAGGEASDSARIVTGSIFMNRFSRKYLDDGFDDSVEDDDLDDDDFDDSDKDDEEDDDEEDEETWQVAEVPPQHVGSRLTSRAELPRLSRLSS
jgi:hypothetical protein